MKFLISVKYLYRIFINNKHCEEINPENSVCADYLLKKHNVKDDSIFLHKSMPKFKVRAKYSSSRRMKNNSICSKLFLIAYLKQ